MFRVLVTRRPVVQRAIFNIFLNIFYMSALNSCTTTEMTFVSPEAIESGSTGKITKIELKDGTIINCRNKKVKINKSDSTGFIVLTSADTVKSGDNRSSIQMNEQRIPESDILNIQLEKSEADTTKTVFVILGIAAGAALVYLIVLIAGISGSDYK